MKKKKEKRLLVIENLDGTKKELNLVIATSVKTDLNMIHFEEIRPDEWRIIWNKNLIPDMSKVKGFYIKREGEQSNETTNNF